MRSDLFMHEVTGTSNVFGRKSGVKVVFKGENAATDHETIYLPSLGADKDISDEQQRIVRGYADHEAGHIRHTDRKASRALAEECVASNNMLLKHTWNALEDIWLERRVISEYPGSLENLKATASAVDRNALKEMKKADPAKLADPKFVGPVAITWEGRKPYGHGTGKKCLDMIDPKLAARLPDWIAALDECKRTEDVIDLARRVVDELRSGELGPEKEEEIQLPVNLAPTEGDGEGDETIEIEAGSGSGGEADSSTGEGEATGKDGPTPEYGDGPSGEKGADPTVPEKGTEEDTKDREPTRFDEEVFDKFDLADIVKEELKPLTKSSRSVYRPYTTEHDKWHSRHTNYASRSLYSYGSASLYEMRLNGMAGQVNVARRTLERVLAAKLNRDWDYGREAGRLDTRRLVRAYSAQPNVFKLRQEAPAIDTAVLMLIDLSGSMAGYGKAQTARDVAIVFAEAMTKAGIAVEVLGFANESGPKAGYHVGDYSRYEPLDMYIFKAFDERLIDARAAMSVIDCFADGNNTDGEALLYAYDRLKKRPEKRRILLTLSDGHPYARCAYDERTHLGAHLRQVIGEITKRGVECVGIGILDDAVQNFYPRWAVIEDISSLGTSVMNEIGKVLVGDRFNARGAA